MENMGIGAGLAAIGFWGFIAVVAVASIWDNNRKREAKHETLRRMVEGGKDLDRELMDKLLAVDGGSKDLSRDLRMSGHIMMFLAPGLAVLGIFLAQLADAALMPLLGVAVLIGFISAGLLYAAKSIDQHNAHG